jgi:hypothetical protein
MVIPLLFVTAGMGVIEALANNGCLLCFRYSGFYAAHHSIINALLHCIIHVSIMQLIEISAIDPTKKLVSTFLVIMSF